MPRNMLLWEKYGLDSEKVCVCIPITCKERFDGKEGVVVRNNKRKGSHCEQCIGTVQGCKGHWGKGMEKQLQVNRIKVKVPTAMELKSRTMK